MSPPSQKPRVLLTGEIDWAQDEWKALSDVATLEVSFPASLINTTGGRLEEPRRVYQGFEGEVQWCLCYLPHVRICAGITSSASDNILDDRSDRSRIGAALPRLLEVYLP
jgi:hypothetical protein